MTFIGPDDHRWQDLLRRTRHDVYHLPQYAELEGERLEGRPLAFYTEVDQTEVLIPFVQRALAGMPGLSDLVSPYGYPGPLAAAARRGGTVPWETVFDGLREAMARERMVTAFVRLHPLLNGDLIDDARTVPGLRVEGPTVGADLAGADWDAILPRLRRDHRRYVRAAVRHGYRTHVDDWNLYPAFVALYLATMERLEADAQYFFSDAYFEGLRTQPLAPYTHLVCAVSPAGDVVAGSLFFACGGIVQYHLSASSAEHASIAPTKLVIAEALRWGSSEGYEVLHLGGGLGSKEDGLLRFKQGFGTFERWYATVRVVSDQDLYGRLGGRPGEVTEGFFPAYRAKELADAPS
jgi:hypothetical protein